MIARAKIWRQWQSLGLFLFFCFPLSAQYPHSGYAPMVPTTLGATDAPVVVVEPPPAPQPLRSPIVEPPPVVPVQPVAPMESVVVLRKGEIAPERAEDVLSYWFGALAPPEGKPSDDQSSIWFSRSPEIDRQIRDYFAQDVLKAARGEYNGWRDTARGRLALILLLDQLPRRIYNNEPQAFMFDRMAKALVLEGLQKRDDERLLPLERAFFYLPLEHAEDPESQTLAVAYYRQLWTLSPSSLQPQIQAFLQTAISHQQQIAHFGRFPHRNAILGRESTPEEMEFLNQRG